jgi:catechol 2,3-dioxygenase-like lactoylglutathione lyase family enzyme
MKRALLLLVAMSLCLIALDLRAEERPLAARVDHFYVESDQAHSLFTFFKDTFQMPEGWPFRDAGTHTSGGLWLGNTILEFVTFPHKDDKPMKTEFRGIAFEPAGGADETAAKLTKRGISRTEVENNMRQGSDGQMRVAWSLLDLKDFPPTEASIFFVDYKFRKSVAAKYKAIDDEFAARNRGPLGIVGAAEITVGVQDLEEARSKWSALLAPSPRISDDAFVFDSGPRIRLVRAESPGIQGIVLKVRSLDGAAKFLEERGLLAKDDAGHIAISPAAIDGLSIRLIDDNQAEEPGNPLLGHGLGVDHVGIAVRDLEKTINDFEQMLGFKCIKLPPKPAGVVSSVIFFENSSYLELLSVSKKPSGPTLSDQAKRYADFAEKHEGAKFLGLATSSAKDAADYLKAQNFEAFMFGDILGNYVDISHEPSGDKQAFPLAVFLIEYVSRGRLMWLSGIRKNGMMDHPNAALRIHSTWFAVQDLDASLENLKDAGFESGETRQAKFLGAKGQEVKAGKGSLLVLEPVDDKGALSKFLTNHDDGEIIGISIEVSDLNKACSWVEEHSGHKLEPYDGYYGRSLLIPPDLTHGVRMEFFQRQQSAGEEI